MAFIVIGVLLLVLVALPLAILLLRSGEKPSADARVIVSEAAVAERESVEELPEPEEASEEEVRESGAIEETVVLECPSCGQPNRVPVGPTGSAAYRCAKCKGVLPGFSS